MFKDIQLPRYEVLMDHKENKTVEFEYKIGDIVILRPVDGDKNSLDLFGNRKLNRQVQYRVISRVYEELSGGDGIVCYAVRHIDVEQPGGGKMYKFQEEELMLHSSYQALVKLVENAKIPAEDKAKVNSNANVNTTTIDKEFWRALSPPISKDNVPF